jgi:hypothetical protein
MSINIEGEENRLFFPCFVFGMVYILSFLKSSFMRWIS